MTKRTIKIRRHHRRTSKGKKYPVKKHDRRIEKRTKTPEARYQCPVCGETKDIINDKIRGEVICNKCATVIAARQIDQRENYKDRDRTGPPNKINDSLMTEIGYDPTLTGEQRALFDRTRKKQRWNKSQKMKNFKDAKETMLALDREMGFPDVVKNDFNYYYNKLLEKEYTRGRSIKVIVPALLYLIHRQRGIARSMNEFVTAVEIEDTNDTKKKIWKTYKELINVLDIKRPNQVDRRRYTEKFVTQLKLPSHIYPQAMQIITEAERRDPDKTRTKNSRALAAAAIYMATQNDSRTDPEMESYRTQDEIAKAVGISEPTLRKQFKWLKKNTNYLNN